MVLADQGRDEGVQPIQPEAPDRGVGVENVGEVERARAQTLALETLDPSTELVHRSREGSHCAAARRSAFRHGRDELPRPLESLDATLEHVGDLVDRIDDRSVDLPLAHQVRPQQPPQDSPGE